MNNLKADIDRLGDHGASTTAKISGLISQQFLAILTYLIFHYLKNKSIPTLLFRFPIEKVVEPVSGVCIPAACKIGPGLRIYHFGGIIMHENVQIGSHASLYHDVTIGVKHSASDKAPKIGDHVEIGAGARILGDITIGNHVTIGANSVVLCDVPDGCIAVGLPAKIIYPKSDKKAT